MLHKFHALTYDGKMQSSAVQIESNKRLTINNKTPAKHRDIFRLLKKSGEGEIRMHYQLSHGN